uniref:Uncharacterized protein n=1 Tax=Arundo donax TaxID=35708 RepID=A0A0A9AMS3_ARUDO
MQQARRRGCPAPLPEAATASASSRTRLSSRSCPTSRRGRRCARACSSSSGAACGPPRAALTSASRATAAVTSPLTTAGLRRLPRSSRTFCSVGTDSNADGAPPMLEPSDHRR